MHPFEIDGRTYLLDQLEQDLPSLHLIRWLESQPLYPKVFWKERDEQVARAAVGNLLAFNSIPRFSGSIPYKIRLYGGIRLAEKCHDDDTWRGFPKRCFWLPQIEVSQVMGKTKATFHFLNEKPSSEAWKKFDAKAATSSSRAYSLLDRQETPTLTTWRDTVSAVLEAISSGQMDKLVLARKTTLQFSEPISVWPLLDHLMEKAKRATLFAFQLSPSLCFLGATPEKLFERTGNVLNTDAVAATRPRGKNAEEDFQFQQELLNSAKERREFNIVKEFLETTVSPFSKEAKWDGQDKVLKASHVQHIHNRLNATLKTGVSDAELVHALHPTPALGGFPRDAALALLKRTETFDRGWYGAPVGMISPEGASLYVAIRSALVRGHSLHLFAGTGLVQGSIAEREWEELEQKIRPFAELLL
jgi:menaquinone-specific isochorismate synthase